MAGGEAKSGLEEELSSHSSSGCDSEKWETSEEGRTKSKNKLLPDGFLDPLPPQKSSKLPRFSGRIKDTSRKGSHKVRRCDAPQEDIVNPTPLEVHPSIANLRGSHRAAHPNEVIWEPYTPELMIWLPEICVEGKEIWHARIPLISWKRVEWHMSDRVMRQFGGRQTIELKPMEHAFRRVDGRGKTDVDWMNYHHNYIEMWNNRRTYIIEVTPHGDDQQELLRYMHWYKSWASLYLLKAPTTPPDTYYPRSSIERILVDYYMQSKGILHPFFGGHGNDASAMQLAMDKVASLCSRVESSIHIDFSAVKKPNTHKGTSQSSVVGVGPSKVRDHEPFTPANPRPSAYTDPRLSMIPNTRPPGTVPCNQLWPSFNLNSSASKCGQLSSYLQVPFTMTPYNMTVPFWMSPTAMTRLPAYPNYFCMPLKQHSYYMEQTTTHASTSAQADGKVEDTVEEHQLQACPLRGLEKCTPDSDAIPHKRRQRK